VTEIKWSKKEVVVRHHLDRYGYPTYPRFDVNVYRWKNYRLEKELYGENRLSYHIVEERQDLGALYRDIDQEYLDYYLCDYHGSLVSPHAKFFSTIKEATQWLKFFLESDEEESIGVWINPKEKHIWGVLSYKPKSKKPLLFWDGVDRKIKLNKSLK